LSEVIEDYYEVEKVKEVANHGKESKDFDDSKNLFDLMEKDSLNIEFEFLMDFIKSYWSATFGIVEFKTFDKLIRLWKSDVYKNSANSSNEMRQK
jgi:hypothetical protein